MAFDISLPHVPIINDIRVSSETDDGWKSYTGSLTVSPATQYEPIGGAEVLTFQGMAVAKKQVHKITQFQFRETASGGGTVKKNNLIVYLFAGTDAGSITQPVDNTVYSPATTYYLGQIAIASADYKRITADIWEATVFPNLTIVTPVSGNPADIHIVTVFDATPTTYDATTSGKFRMFTELHAGLQ